MTVRVPLGCGPADPDGDAEAAPDVPLGRGEPLEPAGAGWVAVAPENVPTDRRAGGARHGRRDHDRGSSHRAGLLSVLT